MKKIAIHVLTAVHYNIYMCVCVNEVLKQAGIPNSQHPHSHSDSVSNLEPSSRVVEHVDYTTIHSLR